MLRNRGVSWKGGFLERGVPNCFISYHSEKHVFITVRILVFLVWLIFTVAVINRSIHPCGLLSTRKWYIIKFIFLLLLFLNIFFVKILLLMTFNYIFISLKTSNVLENKSCVRRKWLHNYILIFIIMNL